MVAGVGSGGAYATDGGLGVANSNIPFAQFTHPSFPDPANNPRDTPGGDSGQLGLAPPDPDNTGYLRRTLMWQAGFLNGGSGGGGGGCSQYWTKTSGYDNPPAVFPCIAPQSVFNEWHDHSGAAGGSGGGALHLVSGKRLQVDGVIDASGGNGGTSLFSADPTNYGRYAMPGGGGSGGAIKLQGAVVALGPSPGRLDVSGGRGGFTSFDDSVGGWGSPGLVRVEDFTPGPEQISCEDLAPSIAPFKASTNSLEWVSVAPMGFDSPVERPGSMTASSSCWLRPQGSFDSLEFVGDSGTDPSDQGWNMDVYWQRDPSLPEELVPFRGIDPTGPFPSNSFEDEFGTLLGHDLPPGASAAPIVVRFQGARAASNTFDPCDFDLDDPLDIVPGSVTPWVDHPRKLNVASVAPNIFRFVVIFDGTIDPVNNDTPGMILFGAIRGIDPTGPFPNDSFEDTFGILLGHDLAPGESAAPIVVRFQGARAASNLDPCDFDLDDPLDIVPGSVTRWVDHPRKLNAAPVAPDMFRFVVIYDGTIDVANNDTPGTILFGAIRGITNMRVTVDPQ